VSVSWQPLNLANLEERPPIKPTLGGVGLLYPGKRHVFSGPQESAKTLAGYAFGVEVVRQGGAVLLIDFEMGQWDARDRFRELGATDEDFQRIDYVEPEMPADEATILKLVDADPKLVIIDAAAGAYDLQGLDDNKRGDVERFAGLYIRRFFLKDIATILIDHVVKDAKALGHLPRPRAAELALESCPETGASAGSCGRPTPSSPSARPC
jgi:AAA domain